MSEAPKPVAPAESITQPPTAVLDTIAHREPSVLERARETVIPILGQVQQAAKPYADAAIAKGQQLVDKLDAAAGIPPTSHAAATAPGAPITTAPSTANTVPARDIGAHASTTTAGLGAQAQAHGVPATAAEAGEKVKEIFGQISSTVSNTFNSVTHTINEKTASGDKPGILAQVTTFAETTLDKVDSYLNQSDPTFRPVQTTTNSVPHTDLSSNTGSSTGSNTEAWGSVPDPSAKGVPHPSNSSFPALGTSTPDAGGHASSTPAPASGAPTGAHLSSLETSGPASVTGTGAVAPATTSSASSAPAV